MIKMIVTTMMMTFFMVVTMTRTLIIIFAINLHLDTFMAKVLHCTI